MRILFLAFILVVSTFVVVAGQAPADAETQALLERLFPDAASFSAKEGSPPHYKVFGAAAPGTEPEVIGFAYWTTELEPLERAFDGPIKIFVGMGTNLVLRGIVVTEHREPYGDFSVDLPEFAAQFEEKSARERFRVGNDIDAISRATISVTSASRAVRNSSRRIARALLAPPDSN
jgi:NosR/NirI family nitrous oxide reductase transcriptional regulator